MPRLIFPLFVLCLLLPGPGAARAADDRELVKLPAMMQEHMLSNMRDHLRALDEIFLALAEDRASDAAKVAERRLGMSSLDSHGADHLAPFMPGTMKAFGTAMHRAASRFARAIETADIEPSPKTQRAIYAAFQEITANCTGCHQAYRIR
ncbi:MAG: hypothetical protein COW30_08780 [Rhodospirillales bacterium CG15_BIG_FIL_POST_REV_8_21_14_020_66_15]|nr:MAG: hypothetical protein COW30_08780 [Rhodospirillales bacterium CG15_BIG_FIL_POST_REV_8_21_14_020_66_15]